MKQGKVNQKRTWIDGEEIVYTLRVFQTGRMKVEKIRVNGQKYPKHMLNDGVILPDWAYYNTKLRINLMLDWQEEAKGYGVER